MFISAGANNMKKWLFSIAIVATLFLTACPKEQELVRFSKSVAMLHYPEGNPVKRCTVFAVARELTGTRFVTAGHCVESNPGPEGPYFISFNHETFYPAVVLKHGERNPDIALLFVKGLYIKPLPFGETPKRGDVVAVFVGPDRLAIGAVSAIVEEGFMVGVDAVPGGSGAPVIKEGKVVGVLVTGGKTVFGFQIGAVRIEEVKAFISAL